MKIALTLALSIKRSANDDTEPDKEGAESSTERLEQPRMIGFTREDELDLRARRVRS